MAGMTMDRGRKHREIAFRGKYRKLYAHLCSLSGPEWRTSFDEIETILGFALPPSARIHRPWWANQTDGHGHSHSRSWSVAGWETAHVNMDTETLLFRQKQSGAPSRMNLDDMWPVHRAGAWPESLGLSREEIYEDRI